MREVTAGRTLVKSPPELWAVCSDAESLAQHLEAFGEIRITRLEPETTVAWEGERASGTVLIEPTGWGTKVTVTAAATEPVAAGPGSPVAASEPAPEPILAAPEPEDVSPQPEATHRPRFLARLFGGAQGAAAPQPPMLQPEPPQPEPVRSPVQEAQPPVDPAAALEAALDSLGQAHKRPFSR